jgi:hypothetical protein
MIKHSGEKGVPFDVWVVYERADERDHGYPNTHLVFTDEAAAKEEAMSAGYYGGNAHVGSHKAILDSQGIFWLLDQQISDIDKTRHAYEEKIKQQALKKLTDEEQRVLRTSWKL